MVRYRALPALLLSAAILVSTASAARGFGESASDFHYPEKVHLPVDYADMAYTGYDDDPLQGAIRGLFDLGSTGALGKEDSSTRAQVQRFYDTILTEYDRLSTQYTLIDLQRDADVTNAWAAAEAADFADRFTYAADQCYGALSLLIGTPYADLLDEDIDASEVKALKAHEPMTEEERELYRQEEALVQEYENVMAQDFAVTYQGETWTYDELSDSALSTEDHLAVQKLLEQAENEAVGNIFLELVQVRTQLAKLSGYRSYADYAYESLYSRDYDAKDSRRLYQTVKAELVPLYDRILELAGDKIAALERLPAASGEEMLDAVQPFMGQIHPELDETFRFLREHRLYDIEPSPTKNHTGYTVSLPTYGSAFIFDSPYGDHRDYSTLIHEFGHFNETFHATEHDLWADFHIDVGEIHSQGLEVLFTHYADDLFGPNAKGFVWNTLLNMVDSALEGCMYDEFQAAVYADPDMSLAEINRCFKDISEDYGYVYDDGETESYFWAEIPHTFQQPMYYISYATSALSALDLWDLAQDDWDAAVDTYMELSALSMTLPYREAVDEVGLRDIFDTKTIPDLADTLDRTLSANFGRPKLATAHNDGLSPFPSWRIAVTALALGVLVVASAAGAVLSYRRDRSRSPTPSYRDDPWD